MVMQMSLPVARPQLCETERPRTDADQIGTGAAEAVGRQLLRLARELTAKRAVERYIGQRTRKARSRRDAGIEAIFHTLPCCIEHGQLQESVEIAEQNLSRGSLELSNAARARNEEVAQLGAEVSQLRQRLRARSAAAQPPRREDRQADDMAFTMEAEMYLVEAEAEALRAQVAAQRAEIEAARRQILQAQREAAGYRSSLEAEREHRERDLAELRRQLGTGIAADPGVGVQESGEGEGALKLLLQCCRLHGPANALLQRYGEPLSLLPPDRLSADCCAGGWMAMEHVPWLKALVASLAQLCMRLESEVTARAVGS